MAAAVCEAAAKATERQAAAKEAKAAKKAKAAADEMTREPAAEAGGMAGAAEEATGPQGKARGRRKNKGGNKSGGAAGDSGRPAAAAAVAVPETGAGEAGSSTAVVLEPSPREARSTEGSECHGDREPPPRCGDGCGCAPVQADGLTKEDGVPGTVQTASTETPASHQEYDLGTGGKHKPKAQSEASWRMVSFRDEGSCWKLAAVAALLAAVAVCARTRVHVRR